MPQLRPAHRPVPNTLASIIEHIILSSVYDVFHSKEDYTKSLHTEWDMPQRERRQKYLAASLVTYQVIIT